MEASVRLQKVFSRRRQFFFKAGDVDKHFGSDWKRAVF